ncbi:hypothetical protein FRUB_00584 [Fimbriiglobus ruber]|uniref:Uncharacterized protein n=1 Tax=Fimbriiglobus ruber TaxID=1908690 RepID=A0A225EEV3_9BACT|nr:hypothetical protein FRUB_00584 [Fimbriiglobus ruber]
MSRPVRGPAAAGAPDTGRVVRDPAAFVTLCIGRRTHLPAKIPTIAPPQIPASTAPIGTDYAS